MMFLAPGWLLAAGAVALGVALLHLIARHLPPVAMLPTARFIPARRARAVSRTLRPADLLLLLLRVALVLAAGAALARPVLQPSRRASARVVVLDRSRAVANPGEALDSARALLREGDVVVVFDSAARELPAEALDSIGRNGAGAAPGALSAALILALRATARLTEGADTLELIVVSPLARESWDHAIAALLARWPGPARLARIAMAADSGTAPAVSVRAERDDPLAVAVSLLGGLRPEATVRIVRGAPETADSAWARAGERALVLWPREPDALWGTRERIDTVGAVVAEDAVMVAPLVRDSRVPAGRAVAYWVDGEVAATEQPVGRGCIRSVAIAIPSAGDLALRPDFARLVGALSARCGGELDLRPVAAQDAARHFDAITTRPARAAAGDSLAPWLLALALLLTLLEPLVRRQRAAAEVLE